MSIVKLIKNYEREIEKYKSLNFQMVLNGEVNLALVRKKLLTKAKIEYYEGKFSSLYEARKSVPSVKQLREYMEATNATECEHNRVLWATSKEVQEYLA